MSFILVVSAQVSVGDNSLLGRKKRLSPAA